MITSSFGFYPLFFDKRHSLIDSFLIGACSRILDIMIHKKDKKDNSFMFIE